MPPRRSPASLLVLAATLLACSSSDGGGEGGGNPGGSGGGATVPCDVGALAVDGACSERCPAGEWPDATGACLPAGVPAVLCGPGFVHDGEVACEPILPADPCPPGQLAVPGEESCHEVAPCGSGTWGDIPVEANTVYVQAGATGGDGSSGAPFATIGEGVAAAAPGAIVAIAEGTYAEDVLISGKGVRLWGRCPSLVEIVGQGDIGAVFIREGGSDTEVHDLAITGPNMGIIASAATGMLFSRIHVHDTGSRGIDVEDPLGPTEARVVESLFENNVEVAWYSNAATLTIERSLARDVQLNQGAGRGANAQPSASGTPATLTITGSVIERVPDNGVLIWGSYVTLEGTVIRDVAPNGDGEFGAGIDLTTGNTQADFATLTIVGGLIERSHSQGIAARGGAVDIEGLVVRDVQPEASTGFLGRGIALGPDNLYGNSGFGNVRWSLVESTVGGFQLGAGQWVVAGTRVRNTYAAGEQGAGMIIQDDPENPALVDATIAGSVVEDGTAVGIVGIGVLMNIDGVRVSRVPDWGITIQSGVSRGAMTVVGSLVEDATRIGLNALGADMLIEDSYVRRIDPQGIFGRGVNVQWSLITEQPSTATVRRVQVQDTNETGIIVYGGDAYVEDVWIHGVTPLPDGTFGDGLDALADLAPSTLSITRLRVDDAARAGVATFGVPEVGIVDSTLTCNGFDLNTEATILMDKGSFNNLGGNRCGCGGELGDCKVLSANLQPPPFAEE